MELNTAQVHLAFNHFPIVGVFFAILLMSLGMAFRNYATTRAGLLVLVISALLSIPTFLSGESAEHQIEHLAGVTEERVEEHEEAAEGAFVVILIAGGLGLAGLILRKFQRVSLSRPLEWGAFLLSLISLILLTRTAHYGGLIRHPELDSGWFSISESESKATGEGIE